MHDLARRAIETDEPIANLVREFYGPNGPIVAAGWDVRPQQVRMSTLIAESLDDDRWGLVEAPCGVGKGLSYLVPGLLAALRSVKTTKADNERRRDIATATGTEHKDQEPRRLVVSTANIALQEQLVKKDIPSLAAMLGAEVRVSLLKSKSNYVCRKRMLTPGSRLLDDPRLARMSRWLEQDGTGDKESLDWDPGDLWPQVSVGGDECTGTACPFYADKERRCYWRTAQLGKERAHVIVTNHHYAMRAGGMNALLLAVDEAHELEGAMRGMLESTISIFSGSGLANRAAKHIGKDDAIQRIAWPVQSLMDSAKRFYREKMGPNVSDCLVLTPGWSGGAEWVNGHDPKILAGICAELGDMAEQMGCTKMYGEYQPPKKGTVQDAEESAQVGNLANSAAKLFERVWSVATGAPYGHPEIDIPIPAGLPSPWPGDPWAIYLQPDRRDNLIAHMSPADVSWATAALHAKYPCAVLTSATLPEYKTLRLSLGMKAPGKRADPSEQLIHGPRYEERLPSPYDLPNQGVLVVPKGPDPKDRSWSGWACQMVIQAVTQARGRTLVLCTSHRQRVAYTDALRSAGLPWPVKAQGEEGRTQLRDWFKETTEGVLVASRSFFQGLDVQGESCSCVVIDRIPFARPGEPVEEAVQRLLVDRNGGGSGFMLRSVPDAAMQLAQAAGRLVRSGDDLGAVVLLDQRILKAGGCWSILKGALPPFPVSVDIRDVGNMLNGDPLIGQVVRQPTRGRAPMRRW